AREVAPHAHGEEVGADHQRELGDAVAQQIAAEGAGHQLVDQPARRDQQHGEEQRDLHAPASVAWRLRGARYQMAAAMMMEMPMEMAPTITASAVLCSSRITNESTNTTIPSSA